MKPKVKVKVKEIKIWMNKKQIHKTIMMMKRMMTAVITMGTKVHQVRKVIIDKFAYKINYFSCGVLDYI